MKALLTCTIKDLKLLPSGESLSSKCILMTDKAPNYNYDFM